MKLITHANCMDGLASALIARRYEPAIEVVFIQHNTAEHRDLKVEHDMVFCDIAPTADRAEEFAEAGAWCLDHHKHARDIVELFGDRGVFADEETDPGVSGALLALDYFSDCHGDEEAHAFAELVGVRDTWQKDSGMWEQAQWLHKLLGTMPRDWWMNHPDPIGWAMANRQLGAALRDSFARQVDRVTEGRFVEMHDGNDRRWAVFPDGKFLISDVAEAMRAQGYPCCCGFFHQVEAGEAHTVFSLRSDGSVDVGAWAKAMGGGGHSRAAGFKVSGELCPWTFIRDELFGLFEPT